MFSLTRWATAAVLGVGVLAAFAPAAHAQNPYFQVRPGLTVGQAAYNVAALSTAANAGNIAAVQAAGAYGGYNPYNPGYGYNPYLGYYDPYGGYLRGAADVLQSQGQLMVSQQQAYLMREQVRQEKVRTKRAAFDEYLYERERTPTYEEMRIQQMQQQLLRARNNPPSTEIWSGRALNDILADLKKAQNNAAVLATFAMPLDEEALKHINVTTTRGSGNLGVFKNGGRLVWPAGLLSGEFKEERDRISTLAEAAMKQAEFNNTVDAGTLQQMSDDVGRLQKNLRKSVGDMAPSTYIEAKNYLNNLDAAVAALRQGNVAAFLAPIKAKSIPELIEYMSKNGLQFAPAVPGDEAAYTALHHALARYDLALAAGGPATPPEKK